MGKIRPVELAFQLPENKIIKFTAKKTHKNMLRNTNSEIGYASDLIYLELYVSEVQKIQIPTITYSKLNNYSAWVKGISNLKTSSLEWENSGIVSLQSLPKTLMTSGKIINATLNNLIAYCKLIINSTTEDDYQKYVKDFKETYIDLETYTGTYIENITMVKDILTKHSKRLENDSKEFSNLSVSGTQLTEEQQKQIKEITDTIKEFESQRETSIAGAIATGVLTGICIAGGIAFMVLVPGVGIPLGVACFFGAGVSATGMGICIADSIELKKKIESNIATKNEVEKEQIAIQILNTKFELLSEKATAVCEYVEDIWSNWTGILAVANNIQQIIEKMPVEKMETTKDIWKSVKNDLEQIQKLIQTLEEPLNSLDYQTQLFKDCDVSDCETEEECLKKLMEYAEKEMKAVS